MDLNNYNNPLTSMTNAWLLIGSWVATFLTISLSSAIPLVLSCLLSVLGIINYIYQIKNNRDKNKERDRDRDLDRDLDRDNHRDKIRDRKRGLK